MAGKVSIYLGERAETALAGSDNRSGRLEEVCNRYLAIVAEELERLDLSETEWSAALNGFESVLQTAGINISRLRSDPVTWRIPWMLALPNRGIADKWGVDVQALTEKMERFSLAQRAAFAEACDRYVRHRNEGLAPDQATERAGVRPRVKNESEER
jgi:hypothetical protein